MRTLVLHSALEDISVAAIVRAPSAVHESAQRLRGRGAPLDRSDVDPRVVAEVSSAIRRVGWRARGPDRSALASTVGIFPTSYCRRCAFTLDGCLRERGAVLFGMLHFIRIPQHLWLGPQDVPQHSGARGDWFAVDPLTLVLRSEGNVDGLNAASATIKSEPSDL